jgi:hypothetical protein
MAEDHSLDYIHLLHFSTHNVNSISSVTEVGTFPSYIKIKEHELKEHISTINSLNMYGTDKDCRGDKDKK